jgi:uncharacterized repeat protein (TIGR01451 family)
MKINSIRPRLFVSVLAASSWTAAMPQVAVPQGIAIRTFGEVAQPAALAPADHVVGGDEIVYTVEIHNTRSRTIMGVAVTDPVPEHMLYVADSAAGPAADITFSVDAGRHFGKPAELKVQLADNAERAATVADYTHIRWSLKNGLRGHATAFARFRAVVKK